MTIEEIRFEECESCKEHEDIYFYKVNGNQICSCDEVHMLETTQDAPMKHIIEKESDDMIIAKQIPTEQQSNPTMLDDYEGTYLENMNVKYDGRWEHESSDLKN